MANNEFICKKCKGHGVSIHSVCSDCNGNGYVDWVSEVMKKPISLNLKNNLIQRNIMLLTQCLIHEYAKVGLNVEITQTPIPPREMKGNIKYV